MPVVLDKPDHVRQRVAQEDADLVGEIPLAAKPLRKLRQQRVRRAGAVALALQKKCSTSQFFNRVSICAGR